MVDSIYQFYVDGVLIDTITASPVSWSTATLLIGEGQGVVSNQPAATWWFDQASIMQLGVEQLGNTGFESALAGSYLTPNVYGNWVNIHPSRGSNRYNDLAYAGSWSGGIKKGLGYGCWLHQDTYMTSLDYSETKVKIRRSSTTPNGACGMQVMLDWDRGGGFAAGYASMGQTNAGTMVTSVNGINHTGFTGVTNDVWHEWKIRIYPLGIIHRGWAIGIPFGTAAQGWS